MCYDRSVTNKPHDNGMEVIHIYNIAKLRKAKGWTQETLADESGVHRVLIARYEKTGMNMTIKTAEKLATALGCTIDELFAGKEKTT